MALVKHNNNSISAVTSMASLSTGSMTLIKEVTANSDASISFVDGSSDVVLDSTYPIYKFEFINVHPATDNVSFSFQASTNGGSSYGVTLTSTFFNAYHNEAGSDNNLGYRTAEDLAQSTSFQGFQNAYGNGNDESGVGFLHLFNPSDTTFVKHFIGTSSNYHSSNYAINNFVAGYFNTTSAIDAIQFKMSSGNIDAGTIKLYGIKDS